MMRWDEVDDQITQAYLHARHRGRDHAAGLSAATAVYSRLHRQKTGCAVDATPEQMLEEVADTVGFVLAEMAERGTAARAA